jgi:hypothetical protein
MKKLKYLKEILKGFSTVIHLEDGSKSIYPGYKPKKQRLFFGCNYMDEPTIVIKWLEQGRGFGEYVFYQEDGKLYCKNECDSKETVMRIMCHMVDQAIFTEPRREKKCKLKPKSNSKSKSSTRK